MKRKWLSLLLTLVLLVSLIPVSPTYAEQNVSASNNPVIWADVPDPDVIRVGNAYYMTSTTMHMNPGVPIMKSYDLIHWEIVNYVYDVLGDDEKQTLSGGQNEYGKGSWASSLRYNNGKYYVTFSSSTTGRTYIFQTTDIEHGPWTKSELGFHHDMSLLFDDDGRVYLVDGSGDIRITELNADATAVKPGGLDQVIIPNASLAAGNNVGLAAEGTHIQKINGKYYVFLITWPSGGMRTELVFRSDSITGPYEGRVALQDQGIAQGGIIDTVKGDWYALLFGDRGAVGRIPYLVPVTWTDGWPVFGVEGKVPTTIDTGLSSNGITATKVAASDEFYQNASQSSAYHTVVKPKASVQPVPSSSTGGTEILVNGGFENDQDASWAGSYGAAVAATDTEHSSGSKALLISGRTVTGDGPKQVTTGKIQAGVTYRFSAKVKYTSGPDTKPFNFDIQHGPSWQGIKILGSKTIAKGEWGTIEGTYTVPADADISQTFIFIETPWVQTPEPANDLMDFYVDDVSMLDTSVSELIDNGNAEAGLAPWTANGAAAASMSDAEHYSGAYSILTTGRKATGDGAKQVITGEVTAGATYQFSAKVKYTSGPDQKQFNFDIQNGPSWQGIKILGSKTIKKGEWGTVEGTYTLPADADISQTFIFLETPWTGTPDPVNDLMDFYVDDVSFVQKALPAAAAAKNGENDDNGSNLALVWQWNHNPDNNNWSLTDRPGYLRLTTGRKSTTLLDARNTLTQRSFGPESSGAIAVDVGHMKDGDYAGLAALQAKYGFVGVKMSGSTRSIVMVDGSGAAPVEAASIPLTQDRVYFKIDMDFKNQADNAAFYFSLDGLTWVRIGNALHMQYTLPHFMGYRFALFNYATKVTGGYADFDYFRISDKLTGENAPAAVLQADLGDVSDVIGVPNVELEVPITLSALPEGSYSAIDASFNIPKGLSVSNVSINTANVVGAASYTFADHRLQIKVAGGQVNVKDGLFATMKLKVEAFATSDHSITITTDYVHVEGGDVVYDVRDAVSNIGLKQLNTGAIGKLPGYSNPLMSHKYGADPYALVFDGRVYVYMTNDAYEYDSNGNIKDNTYGQIKTINVISSADMVNWTDHGAIPVAGANGAAKWAGLSWAPAAAHKVIDGKDKFFLYFANGAGGIGVLTADSPTGPWTDPIGGPLVSFATEGTAGVVWLFDPAVLVDDDGSAYLYFGGGIPNNPTAEQAAHPNTARVIRLTDDMVHTVGAASTIDAPYMFEDSGIHKYNGKYYYTYCSNFAGTHPEGMPPAGEIAYMVSDSPMGPFTYVGSILKNPGAFFGVGGNNHHAIFEFNNEWYVVYHAQTLSKAALGEGKGYRSTHINKVHFYEDGAIKSIQADMEGVGPAATLNPYQRTEAETLAWQAGIATEPSTAPAGSLSGINLDVTNISNGDWVAVSNVDFGDKGAASFAANVAGSAGGKIELRLDSPIGQVIGTLNVTPTKDDQTWQLLHTDVTATAGVHNLFLLFQGGDGSKLFNLDYWQFTEAKGGTTPPEPTGPKSPIITTPPGNNGSTAGVRINGEEGAGTAETTTKDGRTQTVVTLDQQKLEQWLAAQSEPVMLSIEVDSSSDAIIGDLNVSLLKSLQDKQAVIEFKTRLGSYRLHADQIDLNALAGVNDGSVSLKDIQLRIEIAASSESIVQVVENAAKTGAFTLIAPPVEFTVSVVHGDTIMLVDGYTGYVERSIAIPDGVDPTTITTAIVVEPDGTVRHVPTKVVTMDGKSYARISSVTNSTYAVIAHPVIFADMAQHWAKEEVEELASRMVVNGTGSGQFSPNNAITRAEFAAIIVRGLGLKLESSAAVFTDVAATAWYSSAVKTAQTYGLIDGFKDGTFRPNDAITREQAMTIMAKAMVITGLIDELAERSADDVLGGFADTAQVSSWAKTGVALSVQSGIVSGRNGNMLAPKATITRAEVAKIVQLLLHKSDLI
ncbi:hypothetical protein PCCS19_35220 [Paenibacillus sp. CCS19]|uniref:family 43 glycosylhydrolase n=1 Tax=Paenibacillus sp. CCS19 TaxID=3158387 RepID=UPI00256C8B2B|nr:family 43 glycosylhydrolase [Paenibacillus cellulosilyticus]GMK40466.1 hypothetical protein PCCS19_35220 [Paenibacillus cellulosilyticus]